MAAENGTPKDEEQRDSRIRRTKPGMTIDLEAEAAADKSQAADETATSGTETRTVGEPAASTGDEDRPNAEDSGEGGAPAAPMSSSPEAARRQPNIAALLIAGVLGGALVLALGYILQATEVLPVPGRADARQALVEVEGLKASLSELDQRLTSIEAASAQSIADRALLDDLSQQVGVVDSFSESLGDRLLVAEASIAELKEAAGGDSDVEQTLNSLSERIARLEATPPTATVDDGVREQLDALSARVTRLETVPPPSSGDAGAAASTPASSSAASGSAVTPDLGDPSPAAADAPVAADAPSADDGATAPAAVLSAFTRAAEQGGPFGGALDAVEELGIAPSAVAELKPLAEKGAPSRTALAAEFPNVADAILAADPAAEEKAGFLDRLTSYGRSLVTIRPAGTDGGGGTESVVARMRAAVSAGDFETALTEREALPAEGQAASRAWAAAVADRLEIDRLVGEIAAQNDADGGSG